jgi:hypothetical protein
MWYCSLQWQFAPCWFCINFNHFYENCKRTCMRLDWVEAWYCGFQAHTQALQTKLEATVNFIPRLTLISYGCSKVVNWWCHAFLSLCSLLFRVAVNHLIRQLGFAASQHFPVCCRMQGPEMLFAPGTAFLLHRRIFICEFWYNRGEICSKHFQTWTKLWRCWVNVG